MKEAYLLIHKKEPEKMEDWEIASRIIEVLDDINWVPDDLAKECIFEIVNNVNYPNNETRMNIVLMAEEKTKSIFPELANIDEIHMDQIDFYYNKWKKTQI